MRNAKANRIGGGSKGENATHVFSVWHYNKTTSDMVDMRISEKANFRFRFGHGPKLGKYRYGVYETPCACACECSFFCHT